MFDIIEYIRKNNCTVFISPESNERFFLSIRNGDRFVYKVVDEITSTVCDELLAELGRKKAFEYGAKHVAKQLRDREAFFKGK